MTDNFTVQEKANSVFKDIVGAMERLERLDRRVNKINIPYEQYYTLLTLPQISQYVIPSFGSPTSRQHATLFGAELIPNRTKFEVVNDDLGNSIPYVIQVQVGHWIIRKIQENLTIIVKSRACPILEAKPNEYKAIETLREMISETEFRKYITHGFVLIKAKSGAIYQVFRNKSHTRVWRNGKVQEEICVRLADHRCPPTDNVIAFKHMIEADEEAFKKCGNIFRMAA